MTQTISRDIPLSRVEPLTRLLDRFQRKATKLGLAPLSYEVDPAVITKEYSTVLEDGRPHKYVIKYHHVTITGEPPCLDGWTFIAYIERLENGVLVRGKGESVPEQYRNVEEVNMCDHCGTRRRRKGTFIIRKGDEYKRLGSSCVKDFTGHPASEALLNFFHWERDLKECSDIDNEWRGCRVEREASADIRYFIGKVVTHIEEHGYVSRTKAREDYGYSTADNVFDGMTGVFPGGHSPDRFIEPDLEKADAILKWVREEVAAKQVKSDYEENLLVACAPDYVLHVTAGLVASAAASYYRAMEKAKRDAERASRKPSEWMGEVGQRYNMKVQFVAANQFDSDYGIFYIVRYRIGDNVIVYKGSQEPTADEEGEELEFCATIKEHGQWKDIKQTVVSRIGKVMPKREWLNSVSCVEKG